MKTLHTIHHKKDERFDVNFFEDAKCTVPFDFKGKEHLYIELKDGDIIPITAMADKVLENASVYTPYIPNCHKPYPNMITTLNDITPNLSKYIPEDNAVLFLNEKIRNSCENYFANLIVRDFESTEFFEENKHKTRKVQTYLSSCKITIFISHGTVSEFKKASEVLKELKEKYGVEEVNLFALHCFVHKEHSQNGNPYTNYKPQNGLFKYKRTSATMSSCEYCDTWDIKYECCYNFNKIITTNSTGILRPEDSSERLQVIDCKEFLEEHLNK